MLSGDATEDEAIAAYQEARDVALARTFALTHELAAFPPLDRFVELQTELAHALDEEAADLAALPDLTARAVPAA
jgi:hypothetical protein